MASLLGLVLLAAVGWSFFMGFMVGRGQNPEQRVEQMTGLQLDGQNKRNGLRDQAAPETTQTADFAGHGAQADALADAQVDTLVGAQTGAGSAAGAAAQATPAQPAGVPATAGQAPSPGPAASGAAPASQEAAAGNTDFPFERPSGDSLAAWGNKQARPGAQANGPNAAQAAAQGRNSAAPNTAQAPAAVVIQEQIYDYVFQVAAFKGEDDADRLRKRLEGRGLRTRLQKSGKVHLVMVNLRGTELDAANLREELKRMKLGAPIQASQKAVPGKSRKTAR